MMVPIYSVPHHTEEDCYFCIRYHKNLGFHINVYHVVNTHVHFNRGSEQHPRRHVGAAHSNSNRIKRPVFPICGNKCL
jgi:hypothetical protein